MFSIATVSSPFKPQSLHPKFLFNTNTLSSSFPHQLTPNPTKRFQPLLLPNPFKSSKLNNTIVPSSTPPCIFKKIIFLLVGSFILITCFKKKVALAVPFGASGSVMEEKSEEEEMCEKAVESDPRNVEALKVVLFKKIRMGKAKEAVKYVENLIDAQPHEVEWRLLLALCYETMGHFSTAKRLFNDILKERPLLIRALHGLAIVMHKKHEGPAVFEMLNEALELACREKRVTEERNIRILIAQMRVAKGDLEEGLKMFQELVDEDPRDFRPYLCQGIIYSLLDKKKEAAQQFEIYRALVPEEFPQRGFLDDVVLTAKETSREQFQKEFGAQYSHRK